MSEPLITKEQIIEYLIARVPDCPVVEVSGVFPSDDSITKYGVYVRDIGTDTRLPYKLGVTYGGSIYTETDTFVIVYISFQNDPQAPATRTVIERMASDVNFFNGYHEVNFLRDVEIGNRSEKYTYTYNCKRLEFNDPVIT